MNIAYPWNMKARPILCMPAGITLTASAISEIEAPRPLDLVRSSASSSSVGGTSLVRDIAKPTVTRQHTAPSQNEANTQYGTPAAVAPVIVSWKTYSDTLASTAPAPVNRLWVRKPRAICDFGSRSEMNAR